MGQPADRAPHARRRNPNPVVQEALEVTWTLKGHLKNAQISYLRVGSLLARVRDKQLYAALKHPDIVSYGIARLGLQRASLYRYLSVHDWVAQSHPEWLQPKPKGFIPDLADATALIWIERRLSRKVLDPKERAVLEDLRAKALAGKLTEEEWREYRRRGKAPDLRALLARLRVLRSYAVTIPGLPQGVLEGLDRAKQAAEDARRIKSSIFSKYIKVAKMGRRPA